MDTAHLTIQKIQDGLRGKEFSCRELTEAYLVRIEQRQPTVNAFLYINDHEARKAADDVDAMIRAGKKLQPLAGVPVAVKDVLMTKGLPTTAGSKILEGYIPPYHATAVQRLLDQRAIVLGKTNCDEFAMGASGENSAYGPTKNPWDTTKVPGGSSSGSAAAVADGQSLVALGTDTGGSIRQPAGFCAIVGMKPTYGRVSRYGLIALASSLDQIGPLARTIDDAAILLDAISGRDKRDATSVDQTRIDLASIRSGSVKGLKVGLPKEYFLQGIDPRVKQAVRRATDLLAAEGAKIVEVNLPHTEYALAVYYILQPAEASSNLARFDGIRYGKRIAGKDLLQTYLRSRSDGLGAEAQRRIMLGTYALSAGYYDAYYKKAQKVRTLIRQDFQQVFQSVDALLTPTSPGLPFALGAKTTDPLTMYLADIFTVSANIAGIPGLSLNCGWADGLPMGVQFLGPMWSEERLLTVGRCLEQALGLPAQLPETA